MDKQQIGVIGLAVMGKNLALNIGSKGFSVAVYNRTREKIDELLAEASGLNIVGTYSLKEFVDSLETPRKIIIMVKAGRPVDETINQLTPYLAKDDILIDGGNSFFLDTIRRNKQLKEEGFRFIGAGISGGEEGALQGPAIMPGGAKEAYDQVEAVLAEIAAKVCGEPCCAYIGPDGAGHYVKMVHNGIEYADMQLICEAYLLLRDVLGLSMEELYNIFNEWNEGELNSYLIKITRDIFSRIDIETGKPVLDVILDKAGQKGTGRWTGQSALDLGVPIPTITEAVFARYISAQKEERVYAGTILRGPTAQKYSGDSEEFIECIRRALYASKICSYAQGFALMQAASAAYGWNLNLGNIAMIFRGGCIIRAQFLNKIKEAYACNDGLANLMLDPYFKDILESYQASWRKTISIAVNLGIPIPALLSALSYFDSYRSAKLPANLLQAQRDYFGAHSFERVDKEGVFHYQWT